MLIKKIVNDWFTGPDGETHDPARFLWFVGVLAFLIFTGIEVYRHDKLDLEQFAFAYSGLLAAGAAGVKIKESTEPAAKPLPKLTKQDDDLPKPPKA